MASKEDLVRIGMEGFALVDAFLEKKGRAAASLCQYQPQKTPLYQEKPVYANEKKNTYMVVQFRDGVSNMHYPKRNSAALRY